ncbi:MAG: carboxypeptidase-like regulatory domain-containing protein [bacterium]
MIKKDFLLISCILGMFMVDHAFSQTILGKVISQETNTPIYGVNVFLINTDAGCATDEKGNFKIENIPPGNYSLAVHHIGYENQYFQIKLYEGDIKEFLVKLKTKIIEGEKIQITEKKLNWNKYYEIFKPCFLGVTSNATTCYLRNPLVLNFKISDDKSTLIASADEMLKIDNYSLGYHLEVILEHFEYSFINQTRQYLMYPKFQEMKSKDKAKLKQWKKKRRKTYKGSLEHFLSTLITETTLKEGFKVFEKSGISTSLYTYDISDFNLTVMDSLLKTFKITFDSHLDIKYPYFAKNIYISGIENNRNEVIFIQNGYLLNPLSVTVYGKWAEYGVADLLPWYYIY